VDQAKPNGVLFIPPGSEAAFSHPYQCDAFPGIGKVGESPRWPVRESGPCAAAAAGRDRLAQVHRRKNGRALFDQIPRTRLPAAWFATSHRGGLRTQVRVHETTFSMSTRVGSAKSSLSTLSELSQSVGRAACVSKKLFARVGEP